MSIAYAIALTICAGSTVFDRETFNKRKEDNKIRLNNLSAQERYEADNRKFLKRLAR